MLRQATVAAYDRDTRGGRVLLDDGVALVLPPGALSPVAARSLRRGQRVLVELGGAGEHVGADTTVLGVRLLTVPPRT